ncbi:MAG: helix-turn-helix transcriptional regulator [Bacteroidota bacterium]
MSKKSKGKESNKGSFKAIKAKLHIGKKIEEIFIQKGMHLTEFAKRVGKTRQHVYNIFGMQSIDTDLLKKVSEVLEFDFFRYYTDAYKEVERLKAEVEAFKELTVFLKNKSKNAT